MKLHRSLLALSFVVSACAHHHEQVTADVFRAPKASLDDGRFRVAVMDFIDATPGGGRHMHDGAEVAEPHAHAVIFADAFVAELRRLPRYATLERGEIVRLLETQAVAQASGMAATDLGRLLHVDGVLFGNVSRLDEHDTAGVVHARVAASVRLIDALSGEVLWSASCQLGRHGTTEQVAASAAAEMVRVVEAKLDAIGRR